MIDFQNIEQRMIDATDFDDVLAEHTLSQGVNQIIIRYNGVHDCIDVIGCTDEFQSDLDKSICVSFSVDMWRRWIRCATDYLKSARRLDGDEIISLSVVGDRSNGTQLSNRLILDRDNLALFDPNDDVIVSVSAAPAVQFMSYLKDIRQ